MFRFIHQIRKRKSDDGGSTDRATGSQAKRKRAAASSSHDSELSPDNDNAPREDKGCAGRAEKGSEDKEVSFRVKNVLQRGGGGGRHAQEVSFCHMCRRPSFFFFVARSRSVYDALDADQPGWVWWLGWVVGLGEVRVPIFVAERRGARSNAALRSCNPYIVILPVALYRAHVGGFLRSALSGPDAKPPFPETCPHLHDLLSLNKT